MNKVLSQAIKKAVSEFTPKVVKDNKDKTAIIWVGDDPSDQKKISYKELHKNVCKQPMHSKVLAFKKEIESLFT